MHRVIAALVAVTLFLSAGPAALAAELARAPSPQAPEIRAFTSAHFGLAGVVKLDGITVDILAEGDLDVPERKRASVKVGPFTAEVVMTGDYVYTRTRFQPRWTREIAPDPVSLPPISAGELTKLGPDTRLVGVEIVGGVTTQHYTSKLDLSDVVDPLLPAVRSPQVRDTLQSINGTVDVWVGASDRMIRQERLIVNVTLPPIEPNGDPMPGTIDLTLAYSKLNEPVAITDPARLDTSPLQTPRPNVQPVVGPAGSPATSTAASGQGPAGGQPTRAPAQVPRK